MSTIYTFVETNKQFGVVDAEPSEWCFDLGYYRIGTGIGVVRGHYEMFLYFYEQGSDLSIASIYDYHAVIWNDYEYSTISRNQ